MPARPTTPVPQGDATAALRAARVRAVHQLAQLSRDVGDVVAASRGSNADDEHDPEGATIAFERSQLDSLVRGVREQLSEIDAAEERLAHGTYGLCETCGGPVAAGRLAARPTARTCIGCAPGRRTRG